MWVRRDVSALLDSSRTQAVLFRALTFSQDLSVFLCSSATGQQIAAEFAEDPVGYLRDRWRTHDGWSQKPHLLFMNVLDVLAAGILQARPLQEHK